MHVERLLRLADLLDRVEEKILVDVSKVSEKIQNLIDPLGLKFSLKDWFCGTTACACGFAALDPWFIEQGLSLEVYESFFRTKAHPVYEGLHHWAAIEKFFGLDVSDGQHLFSISEYAELDSAPPKRVAARIRAFVKSRTTEVTEKN